MIRFFSLTFFSISILFGIGIIGMPIASAASESVTEPVSILAPAYGKLGYKLAEPGTYKLPSLGKAPDGKILDEQGNDLSLHDLYKGKYTLLSFIYSNCKDVNGCPLASYVFYKLKAAMKKDTVLADRLRLASLSFDPRTRFSRSDAFIRR